MKLLLSIAFLASALTAQAGVCQGAKFVAGGTIATVAMVKSYRHYQDKVYEAYIRESDLLRANAQVIFSPIRGTTPLAAAHEVRARDSVVITYTLNEEANRQRYIKLREQNIQTYRARIAAAESEEIAEIARTRLAIAKREIAAIRAGKIQAPLSHLDLELPRTNQVDVAAKLTDLSRDGSKVTKITRIPRVTALGIARASTKGWVLLATAVALGYIASEQAISDSIACRRESELNQL